MVGRERDVSIERARQRPTAARATSGRAVTPVLATLILCAIVVVFAASIGTVFAGVSDVSEPSSPTVVDLAVEGDTFTFTHEHGEPLDVRALTLEIRVDGEPLSKQPPVPFFSAAGFRPGPSGPFNSASSGQWQPGQTASFSVAGTNSPTIEPGATVEARFYTDEDVPIVTVEAVATGS